MLPCGFFLASFLKKYLKIKISLFMLLKDKSCHIIFPLSPSFHTSGIISFMTAPPFTYSLHGNQRECIRNLLFASVGVKSSISLLHKIYFMNIFIVRIACNIHSRQHSSFKSCFLRCLQNKSFDFFSISNMFQL